MKLPKKELLAAILAVSFGACSHTAQITAERPSARAEISSHYVAAELFETVMFPLPPKKDSMEQQADLAGVLAWQNKRTEADCERARRTAKEEYDAYWGADNPFGDEVPGEFKEFFDKLASDFEEALDTMKARFHRPRPFVNNPEAQPCLKRKESFSYPSGHSSAARVTAAVLADIVPERRDEFYSKADGIALDRLVGGVHYPSDIAAGKRFGDLFHAELLRSEDYRKDIEALKKLVR